MNTANANTVEVGARSFNKVNHIPEMTEPENPEESGQSKHKHVL